MVLFFKKELLAFRYVNYTWYWNIPAVLPQPSYVTSADLTANKYSLLGVIGFGAPRPAELDQNCPFAEVPLPLLQPGPAFEAWVCTGPVTWGSTGDIQYATAGGALFGILDINAPDQADLENLASSAYRRIFALADSAGCPHVLRVFNYLPCITAQQGGGERYRAFNAGRHAAFEACGRAVAAAPSACALGTQQGNPVIYFVAAAAAGRPIENPRQVSAYHYPERYGRRSPSFSRAMLAGDPPQFYISGTASIVGHETMHTGNAADQTDETLRNLQALLQAAGGGTLAEHAHSLRLKVYIRHKQDVPAIRGRLEALPRFASVLLLQADICRPDLLVEIEAFCDRMV